MIISEFFAGGMMVAFSSAGLVWIFTGNLILGRDVGVVIMAVIIGSILVSLIGEHIVSSRVKHDKCN
jgi:membrane protein implicated in regulation of membrane protease activity